jgi:predicted HTH domain antitoxin
MRKEQMVGTRLPEDLVRDLETIEHVEQSDRSTTVRKLLYRAVREWKLEHYARLYGGGKVSLARAAKDAGVSLWEMMEYASARKVAAQYDRDDFARDLKVLAATRRRGVTADPGAG